mmetsp:Transcript_2548/g.9065  ORF Transcript_2548/g.9065 Transcript_2548/m.9065 type:complete len:233 (+) Transcript_2548:574-1272(+)
MSGRVEEVQEASVGVVTFGSEGHHVTELLCRVIEGLNLLAGGVGAAQGARHLLGAIGSRCGGRQGRASERNPTEAVLEVEQELCRGAFRILTQPWRVRGRGSLSDSVANVHSAGRQTLLLVVTSPAVEVGRGHDGEDVLFLVIQKLTALCSSLPRGSGGSDMGRRRRGCAVRQRAKGSVLRRRRGGHLHEGRQIVRHRRCAVRQPRLASRRPLASLRGDTLVGRHVRVVGAD